MLSEADRYRYAGLLKNMLGKPQQAVDLFTAGLASAPDDARLYRHRGHRYMTLHRFDDAISDLEHAAELIKGQPDEHEFWTPEVEDDLINLILDRSAELSPQHLLVSPESNASITHGYKSTLHSSVYYHLAVSHYILGQFDKAVEAFEATRRIAVDDDMKAGAFDWLYMTLRRLQRDDDAAKLLDSVEVSALKVNPDEDYYVRRLRMYKGLVKPETLLAEVDEKNTLGFTTLGYGVGNWHLYNGDAAAAKSVFEKILALGETKAFAFMATEADMKRLGAQ